MRRSLLLAILLIASSANARVFDFGRASTGAYINGEYGSSNLQDQAYGKAGGSGNVFDMGPQTQFAGELGVVVNMGNYNIIATAELLRPTEVVDAWGYNSNGTKLMKVTSRINAVIASGGIEYLFHRRPHSRFLFGLIAGYADVTLINSFSLNDAGTTLYPGVGPDYKESINGSGISGRAYLGIEFLLTDNVTCTLAAGYRYFQLINLNYTASATTVNGDVSNGASVTDSDGTARQLDMGGGYGSIGFRFYFL